MARRLAVTTCLAGLALAQDQEGTCALQDGACAEDRYTRLFDWAQQRGAAVDGMELRDLGAGERGIVASRQLPEDHVLLRLPHDLVVTTAVAADTAFGQVLLRAARDGALPDNDLDGLLLTAWLLQEAKSETWNAYISALPAEFPTMPLNFSEASLEACGTGLVELEEYLASNRRLLQSEYSLFKDHAKILGDVTWHRFLWARFVSFSRIFSVSRSVIQLHATIIHGITKKLLPDVPVMPGQSEAHGSILVPLADMVNHRHGRGVTCTWKFRGKTGFVLQTKRAIAAGEELFVSYGSKANDVFLAHYGFVAEGNPKDVLNITLRLSGQDVPTTLCIRGDAPADQEEFEAVLEASRAAAKLGAGGELSENDLEARALDALGAALDEHAGLLAPSPLCPDLCAAYRNGLLGLLDSWRRFVSNARLFLSGEEIDVADAQSTDKLRLHARLYFGIWTRAKGTKLIQNKASVSQAQTYGKVGYLDIMDEFAFS